MDNEYLKYASAYDVAMIYISYKLEYHRIKHNYEKQIKEMTQNNSYVQIHYNSKKEINIQITAPNYEDPNEITFYKENGKLLFRAGTSPSNKNRMILLTSKIAPEMFNFFSDSEFVFNDIKSNISDINSVNSDFKLRINDKNVEIYKDNCTIALNLSEYSYYTSPINFDYDVYTNFVDVLSEVQGNEKRILKSVSFDMHDFPTVFAENLLKYKKQKLIDKNKKEEKQKTKGIKRFLSIFK